MKTRAAVIWGKNQQWKIEEVDLGDPAAGELIVKTAFAGLCHSDEHLVTGDMSVGDETAASLGAPSFFPIIGGHEGSGVVQSVGEGVSSVAVGDHVSISFIPSCGRCHWCATGQQYICDLGATTLVGGMITDGAYRHHINGVPANRMAQCGTFSDYMLLNEASVVKVDKDLPLEAVALVSCGVATGVGSAQSRAQVRSGDTVVVVGIGGIGINAVQGAVLAGAAHVVAIDTNPTKQAKAEEFGASHFFTNFDDAIATVTQLTHGVMANSCILATSSTGGDQLDPAVKIIAKGGTIVVTGLAPMSQRDVSLDLFGLAMFNKEIKGTIFGSSNPRAEIPRLLREYRRGALKIDELVSARYALEDINQGYQDMRDGKNIRGIIAFD